MRFGDSRGSYQIVDLPGSSQVAVSIHSFIFPRERGKGHGGRMHKERLDKLKELGYNYVLCTVREDNLAELKILNNNSWTRLDTFQSSSTSHRIILFGRSIA
jgi:RimJ/RimL family protein N-acetyltransferase